MTGRGHEGGAKDTKVFFLQIRNLLSLEHRQGQCSASHLFVITPHLIVLTGHLFVMAGHLLALVGHLLVIMAIL
ncbi:MAG: hypothetical protein ACK5UE_12250 [Chitinophagales bacterium]